VLLISACGKGAHRTLMKLTPAADVAVRRTLMKLSPDPKSVKKYRQIDCLFLYFRYRPVEKLLVECWWNWPLQSMLQTIKNEVLIKFYRSILVDHQSCQLWKHFVKCSQQNCNLLGRIRNFSLERRRNQPWMKRGKIWKEGTPENKRLFLVRSIFPDEKEGKDQ